MQRMESIKIVIFYIFNNKDKEQPLPSG